ncbi:hypothetical protein [Endozoicomonas acroporae]|uniref:IS66 family transposase n=1 Tax=Endozoicomonas acroporae TaxID=1701104 RepID=UPI003D78BD65
MLSAFFPIAGGGLTVTGFDQTNLKLAQQLALLEEYLRLERARLYGRSSEKSSLQGEIFDETELVDCGEEVQNEASETEKKHKKSQGRRPLSPSLPRFQEKIELSPEEKEGAIDTFFSKVREELDIIPAKVRVK